MNFESLIQSITGLHHHFQQQAVKAVNVHLTLRNWLVGYYIVEFEQEGDERAAYGDKLLAKLALRCKAIKGFDERSFRNFRLFYLRYPQLAQLIAERVAQFPILGSVTTKFTAELIGQPNPIRGSATAELQNMDNQINAARRQSSGRHLAGDAEKHIIGGICHRRHGQPTVRFQIPAAIAEEGGARSVYPA